MKKITKWKRGMNLPPSIIKGCPSKYGLVWRKGFEYIASGTERYRVLLRREPWKPKPAPDPKDCKHGQWYQPVPKRNEKAVNTCSICGVTCEVGDLLTASKLGLLKVRIVVVSRRYPRTEENRKWQTTIILKKIITKRWTKRKGYKRWLKMLGKKESRLRWKRFKCLLRKKRVHFKRNS